MSDNLNIARQFKKHQEKFITKLLKTGDPDILKQHTALFDNYFLESYEKSTVGPRLNLTKNPYAIIALGGYGRQEQCIHSDIDLLFLFKKRVPGLAEELVKELIYPLWDMGYEVGHATRSIKECLALGREDFEVLTSLLDARFICGMSPLFTDLMEQFRNKIVIKHTSRIINQLIESNQARHQKFGDSAYLLEPNLKEGRGGLRDYHTMLWIARIRSDLKETRDLEYMGYLSNNEYQSLSKALAYIWHIRNRVHYLTKRKCDQLHLEYQTSLARALNIVDSKGLQPVEKLLGDLHRHMELIKQQHQMFLHILKQQKNNKRKNRFVKKTSVKGLKFNRGMLNFSSPEEILRAPELLIKIFLESAVKNALLNSDAKRLLHEFQYIIDDHFRSSAEVVQIFEKILMRSSGTFKALNQMLNTGFLACFIPEFKGVVNRIQFDRYHLYPVGRHQLYTVKIIKQFATTSNNCENPLYHDIYSAIKNKKLLLWAALLHDIGKSDPGGSHAKRGALMAQKILEKKGFQTPRIETITYLIRNHLLLIKTATRRDINEEATAIHLAGHIKKSNLLKMLYLLTLADSMATGPKAWNDWTASLLKDLFFKVLNVLEKGELATPKSIKVIEDKKNTILSQAINQKERQELEELYNIMSPRYLLSTEAADISQHIELFKQLKGDDFIWKIEKHADSTTRDVVICAKNRPGLISKIAGVFTISGLDIIDVQIFTWRNNIALDIFKVKAPSDLIFEDQKWQKTAQQLRDALKGNLNIEAEIFEMQGGLQPAFSDIGQRPLQIKIDNQSSSFFTIIEVFTNDFPGLLYKITDTLFRCRLDVWVAKIATKVDQVVDVFYVHDFDGQKIDSAEQLADIKAAIHQTLITAIPGSESYRPSHK